MVVICKTVWSSIDEEAPILGYSIPKFFIEPLRQHIDTDDHRQIRDPHVGEGQLGVVDQNKPAIADQAIDQGSA